MIVGDGMLARAFRPAFGEDRDVLVFASGVANSCETDVAAFVRETALLERACASAVNDPLIVYFSTCSIEDPERGGSPYILHKLAMERQVQDAKRFLVLRLSQAVGHTRNPFTLANFLHTRIGGGRRFPVWQNAWRNLIDVDHVASIAEAMVREHGFVNRTVDIANPTPVRVLDLVAAFERLLGVQAKFDPVDRGTRVEIDARESAAIAASLGIDFGGEYLMQTLAKYYGATRGPA